MYQCCCWCVDRLVHCHLCGIMQQLLTIISVLSIYLLLVSFLQVDPANVVKDREVFVLLMSVVVELWVVVLFAPVCLTL